MRIEFTDGTILRWFPEKDVKRLGVEKCGAIKI